MDIGYPKGVLSRGRRDHRAGVTARGRDGFDIGLNACTTAAVRACDA